MKLDYIKNFVYLSGVIRQNFTPNHGNYYASILEVKYKDRYVENIPILWEDANLNLEPGTPVQIFGEIRRYGKLEKQYKEMILVRELDVLTDVSYDNIAYIVGNVVEILVFGEKVEVKVNVERSYNVQDSLTCYSFNKLLSWKLKRFSYGDRIALIGRVRNKALKLKANSRFDENEIFVTELQIDEII